MILNLTQHEATPEQLAAGVEEPGTRKGSVQALLTFRDLPSREEIAARAVALAALAQGYGASAAMIGGALWLMAPLEAALRGLGIRPLYAFSVRESVEETAPDGSVRKVAVFRHKGFVEV